MVLMPDLVEQGEAEAVEGSILWLAQYILETLRRPGELDAWLHRVGLASDINELKSEVERMETVVNGVNGRGRAVGNKPLSRALVRVKELMSEADDVVDELDYCRLQHQVEGGMFTELQDTVGDGTGQGDASAMNNTATMNNSGRKNRSEVRDYFHIIPSVNREPAKAKCKHCGRELTWGHGTSALHKHLKSCNRKRAAMEETLNSPSVGNSVPNGDAIITINADESRKRIRIEDSAATTTHPWDKATFSKSLCKITLELGHFRDYVIEHLKDSVASFDQSNTSYTRERTSSSRPVEVCGRDTEKDYILGAIKVANSDNITILPIVGILGVGKTALAKFVYNHRLVKRKFERIWIWVSDIFDEVRVTREILDVVTLYSHEGCPRDKESYDRVSNYSKLLEVLEKHMAYQPIKLLLVLDDVSECMDNSRWKDLLDVLRSGCTKGSVIIMTTRNMSVAQRLGTVKPVKLGALEDDEFWQLFKAHVFGDNDYKEHLDIVRQISAKLKGNPLAAESAAEMLRDHPTIHQWESIMKNGVWESLQFRGGIVTALKVCYYELPYNLQQCFLSCSIFPNNHQFHSDGLVYMWISLGFVESLEIGQDCLNALVNSGFLEQIKPEDSILQHQQCYVVCGIMHEFARLVSTTDFATIDSLECKKVIPTVHHLSILTDRVYHKDEQGIILRNVEFEEKLQSIISSVRRLKTLILIGHFDSLFFRSFHTFMCSLVNLTHLRYLKIENKGSSEALPISLSNFYHLEVLDVGHPGVVHGIVNLVSMRHLGLMKEPWVASSPSWFGTSVTCLQTIHLEDYQGWGTIPSLERLLCLRKLKLRNMQKITEVLIPSLEELVLTDMPKLERCSCNLVRDLNSRLRILEISRCSVLNAFPLFERCEKSEIWQNSWLPHLNEFTIHDCPYLMVSNPLPPSSCFCRLSITKLFTLPNMEGTTTGEFIIGSRDLDYPYLNELNLDNKILSFHNLRTITRLQIVGCKNLSVISLKGFRQLVSLKRLEMSRCTQIFSLDVPSAHTHGHENMADANFDALLSLECLSIDYCKISGEWLSVILRHVRALEELNMVACQQISELLIEERENVLPWPRGYPDDASTRSCLCIPSNLIPYLKKMNIRSCELTFQGNKKGFSGFTSLEVLTIFDCQQLISSLVHKDEINDLSNGRWLLPSSLAALYISGNSIEKLQLCFPGDQTRLKVLEVFGESRLESLQLRSCKAMEKLTIKYCKSPDALELECVQSLRGLKVLEILQGPGLPQGLECPRLESLQIDNCSFLAMPFCKHLASLRRLQFKCCWSFPEDDINLAVAGLTGDHETPIFQLLTSLQELRFASCDFTSGLPFDRFYLPPHLKRLVIYNCRTISRLPERGLPPSLEELEVLNCSEELSEQCRKLATRKLDVIIDGKYVN